MGRDRGEFGTHSPRAGAVRSRRTATVRFVANGFSLVEVLVATTVAATFFVVLASGSLASLRLLAEGEAARVRASRSSMFVMEPDLSAAAWPSCGTADEDLPCVLAVDRCVVAGGAVECHGTGPLARFDVRVPALVGGRTDVTLWRWDP